jgi:hypothetical protein
MRDDKTIGSTLGARRFGMGGSRGYQIVAVLAVSLVLFGDTLLPWLGHGLHVVIEVVELGLEHFLEHAFGLSPRGAQIVIAWTGLALVICLSVWAIRKIRRLCRAVVPRLILRWNEMKTSLDSAWRTWHGQPWIKVTLVLGTLGAATVFLFS